MDDEQYYRKVGRRYLPVRPFDGWPADGVWLVETDADSSGRTRGVRQRRLADTPPEHGLTRAALERLAPELHTVYRAWWQAEADRMHREYARQGRTDIEMLHVPASQTLVDAFLAVLCRLLDGTSGGEGAATDEPEVAHAGGGAVPGVSAGGRAEAAVL